MKKLFVLCCLVQLLFVASCSPVSRESKLYGGQLVREMTAKDIEVAVNSGGGCIKDIPEPTLTYMPAAKPNGTAVVICPGGGYRMVCYDTEGLLMGRWLNELGISAFVLKYRIPAQGNIHPAPLHDAQRAIRLVRSCASKYKVDPGRIGIMGFSAGGHLASTTGTHIDYGDESAPDLLNRISSRPDFMILVYPVITFETPYAHMGSRTNLLGPARCNDLQWVDKLSSNLQVSKDTPLNFLAHAADDVKVPKENSILFNLACQAAGVPSELHIYPTGGHGFRLGREGTETMQWRSDCENWMRGMGLIK